MRAIDDHPYPVHLADDLPPEIAQPRVGTFGTAVCDEITYVVGEQHVPHAERVQAFDVRQVFTDESGLL